MEAERFASPQRVGDWLAQQSLPAPSAEDVERCAEYMALPLVA
jgi:hypothetical protein